MNEPNAQETSQIIDVPLAEFQPPFLDDSVPDPEIQPARDDINLNFESSTKYNIVTSAVTSAKIVTTTLLLFSTQLNCWGSQERWIVLMLIFDIVYAVGIFLKIKTMRALDSLLQSVHSSRSVMDTSQRINSIQNTILNIQQRNHSLSDVREPLLINNERTCNVTALLERKKSALTSLLFFGDIIYLILFVYGQIIYFVRDPDICTNYSISMIMLVYLCLGYIWLLFPIILLILSCLCAPCIICLIIMLNRSQVPANRAAIKKLKVKEYTSDMLGSPECTICMGEYMMRDKIIQLGCSPMHHFHEECLKKWLKINGQCPTCRMRLEEMNQSSS